jgi:glycosyltransferase involved in cell wall biosynthesis
MSDPDVSVVMSVYNGADTLQATLDSIVAQEDVALELIVVDDGSDDATPRILAGYAAGDPRIRVLTQANQGLTRALIAGCAAARSAYIARHDAGDLSHPRRLAAQAAALDAAPELAFVSCWTEYVGPRGEPLYVVRGTGAAAAPLAILDLTREYGVLDGPTHHGSVVFRRDAYERAGGYRAEFRYGQDWDLWYRLAALGKFQMIGETLYTAAVTAESISSSSRAAQQEIAALSHAALLARTRGDDEAPIVARAAQVRVPRHDGRRARARGFYFIAEALRRNGDARARRYFAAALRAWPLHARAWLRYWQSLMSYSGSS